MRLPSGLPNERTPRAAGRYDSIRLSDRKLLILTALRMEARAMARALALSEARGGNLSAGSAGGFEIEIRTIGPRAALLHKAGIADAARGACCVVVAGLGGALDPR